MQIGDELTFDNVYEVYFKNQKDINTNDIVIIDGNFHQNSLQKMAQFCSEKGYFTVFEAKGQKSKRVIETGAYK